MPCRHFPPPSSYVSAKRLISSISRCPKAESVILIKAAISRKVSSNPPSRISPPHFRLLIAARSGIDVHIDTSRLLNAEPNGLDVGSLSCHVYHLIFCAKNSRGLVPIGVAELGFELAHAITFIISMRPSALQFDSHPKIL